MSYPKRRLARIEGFLSPKEAAILWMEEVHRFPGMAECARSLLGQPLSAYPLESCRPR